MAGDGGSDGRLITPRGTDQISLHIKDNVSLVSHCWRRLTVANTEKEKTKINSAAVREPHSHPKKEKKQHVRKLRPLSQLRGREGEQVPQKWERRKQPKC